MEAHLQSRKQTTTFLPPIPSPLYRRRPLSPRRDMRRALEAAKARRGHGEAKAPFDRNTFARLGPDSSASSRASRQPPPDALFGALPRFGGLRYLDVVDT